MDVPRPPESNEVAALRKKKAKWRLIAIALAVVIVGGIVWYLQSSFIMPFQQVASFETSISNKVADVFSAPSSTVTGSRGAPKAINALTMIGIVADTNTQRAENGDLPPLAENATLDDIATLRLDDMFANQYFAHVSPTGASAQTVASSVGYLYLALGENLAMGNFAGDTGLVSAWMASPGHRANILDMHYTQIGVAVREGTFQGATTWIAVQVFGKPESDCPSPDAQLQAAITASETEINSLATQLQQSKAAIDAMTPQSGAAYNSAVANYNALATQYNDLTNETKAAVAQYNSEISAFNTCLDG